MIIKKTLTDPASRLNNSTSSNTKVTSAIKILSAENIHSRSTLASSTIPPENATVIPLDNSVIIKLGQRDSQPCYTITIKINSTEKYFYISTPSKTKDAIKNLDKHLSIKDFIDIVFCSSYRFLHNIFITSKSEYKKIL